MYHQSVKEELNMIWITRTLSMWLRFFMYICIACGVIVYVDYAVNPTTKNSGYKKATKTISKDEFIALIPEEVPDTYYELLYETAKYESELTLNARQKGGCALGIMQVEPVTEKDIWEHFLKYRKGLREVAKKYKGSLQYDTPYNIYIAYLVYYRNLYNKKVDLSDKWVRAWVYKKYYNTHKGKGTTKGFYYGR